MLATLGEFGEAEALFLQALEIAPDYYPALFRLGEIRWELGQFAEAVKLGERAVAIEPQMAWMRPMLAEFYLDSGDEDAALAVLEDQTEPGQWISVCILNGGADRVASTYVGAANLERLDLIEEELVPYAIRDAALVAHRPTEASVALQARLAEVQRSGEGAYRWGTMLALAHLQKRLGHREDAEALARTLLDEKTAHLPHRIVYGRPAAYALLDQPDAALAELEANVNRGSIRRWWYTFERDPILRTSLSNDPRFQSLLARVRQHASVQRGLIDGMRERGEIPARKTNGKSINNPC
jgi:tetratricopeptide (TPR) repeat protein